MTLSRRRFLTVSAAFAAMPLGAQAHSWQGFAFGAQVNLTVKGPRSQAQSVLAEARRLIGKLERLFSLYDPASALSMLNRNGALAAPDASFMALMQAADYAHRVSDRLFDPTVQALWAALSQGVTPDAARARVGWDRVQISENRIALGPSQAVTLNGIAQGFATDRIADMLLARGFGDMLVNIGEYRGTGGPFTLALSDPTHGIMGHRTLSDGAIATSSPTATMLGVQGHILHPTARPQWSSVSVEAAQATIADSLSTAMVLAPRDQIQIMKERSGIARVTLVDFDGNLSTV